MTTEQTGLLQTLEHLSAPQLRRMLTDHLTKQKLGLYWESRALSNEVRALNSSRISKHE